MPRCSFYLFGLFRTGPITWWEAIARRFRRNYVWLITLLLLIWVIKLAFHPAPALDWITVYQRAVPGIHVMTVVGVVYAALIMLAIVGRLSMLTRAALPKPLRWLEEQL
ncbi:MAG: DUF2270 domain-containing protein [Chloroflexi bacterium]|nr:DUF2270 domain-containing protein [Chloroflexota bacterium]